jgi:hypothetical protein
MGFVWLPAQMYWLYPVFRCNLIIEEFYDALCTRMSQSGRYVSLYQIVGIKRKSEKYLPTQSLLQVLFKQFVPPNCDGSAISFVSVVRSIACPTVLSCFIYFSSALSERLAVCWSQELGGLRCLSFVSRLSALRGHVMQTVSILEVSCCVGI